MPDLSISSAVSALKRLLGVSETSSTTDTQKTAKASSKLAATDENDLVSVNLDSNSSSSSTSDLDTKIKQLMSTDIPKTESEIDELMLKKAKDIEEQEALQQKAIQENKELLAELKEKYTESKKELKEARQEYDKAAKKKAKEEKGLRSVNREIKNVETAMKSNKGKDSIIEVLQYKKDKLLSTQASVQSSVDDYDTDLKSAKDKLTKTRSTNLSILEKIEENSGDNSPLAKVIKQSEKKISDIETKFESDLETLQQTLTKQHDELSSLMEQKAQKVLSGANTTTTGTTTTTTTDTTSTTGGTTASAGGKLSELFSSGNFSQGVLKDKGAFVEECCKKYNVDPYLAAAIMACETGWGTSNAIVSCNNPGGYMDVNTNCMELKNFSTLEEGIEAVIRNLSENYIKLGLTDINSIGAKYCPVGAANDPNGTNSGWIPMIVSIYKQLSGKEIDASTKLA